MAEQENNFKQMLSQELENKPEAPNLVENRLDGSINSVLHIAKVLELFIPKFIDAVMVFLGGKPREEK